MVERSYTIMQNSVRITLLLAREQGPFRDILSQRVSFKVRFQKPQFLEIVTEMGSKTLSKKIF